MVDFSFLYFFSRNLRLRSGSKTSQSAGVDMNASVELDPAHPETWYHVECVRNGDVVWTEDFHNIVVTTGLNKLLDATLKTGLTSPAWFVGLKAAGSVVLADTMASHAGWAEIAPYSNATRPAFTPGSIVSGSVDNSGAKAVFTVNGTNTVVGCFLTDNSTVSGSTGILFGAGDFGTSRAVISGDTLNVTVTVSVS